MSLIVTSYDLNVEGGCVNCRCSRLQATKSNRHGIKIFTQRRKAAKHCRLPEVFLNTLPSFHARHLVVLEDAIDVGSALFENLFQLISQILIAAADAHRNVEYTSEERRVGKEGRS